MTKKIRNGMKWEFFKPSTSLFVWIILAILTLLSGYLVSVLFSSIDISNLEVSSNKTKRICITDSIQVFKAHGVSKIKVDEEFITLPLDFESKTFVISKEEHIFINKNIKTRFCVSLVADCGNFFREDSWENIDLNSLKQLGKFRFLYVIIPKIFGIIISIFCLVCAFLTILSFCTWFDELKQ